MQRFSPRFRSVQFFMCEILYGAFYGGAMHVGVKINNYLSESWHRLQFVTEFFYFGIHNAIDSASTLR